MEMVSIVEFDEDGRQRYVTHYDVGDLAAALDELEQRFIEGEGAAHSGDLEIVRAVHKSMAEGDVETLAAYLAPHLVVVDHRPIGWGDRDRETFLAAVGIRPSTFGSGLMIIKRIERLTSGAALASYEIRATSPEGIESVEAGFTIILIDDGLVTRSEVFSDDDEAAAIGRFDELTRSGA